MNNFETCGFMGVLRRSELVVLAGFGGSRVGYLANCASRLIVISLAFVRGRAGRACLGRGSTKDMDHSVAKLSCAIDWRFLEERFGAVYSEKAGHPQPTLLIAGLTARHIAARRQGHKRSTPTDS